MAIGFSTSTRDARAQAILDKMDAGAGPATINIYDGTQPATGAAITTQVLLATLTFSDPAGTITGGVLTFSAIASDTSADATGTATWARISDSNGAFVADLNVGASGSGAALELSTVAITAGSTVSITGGTITEGNA